MLQVEKVTNTRMMEQVDTFGVFQRTDELLVTYWDCIYGIGFRYNRPVGEAENCYKWGCNRDFWMRISYKILMSDY